MRQSLEQSSTAAIVGNGLRRILHRCARLLAVRIYWHMRDKYSAKADHDICGSSSY